MIEPSGWRIATATASRPRMSTPSMSAWPPYEKRAIGVGVRSRPSGALETTLEALDLPGRIDVALLAGEEGMAVRAHVDPDLGPRRADRERVAARGARDGRLVVLGVDAGLHETA